MHYPMPEKPGAQNIAACENQGKQTKFSDHRKSIKRLFLKKNNRTFLTQVLTQDFTSCKIRVFEKKKVTQFVKPIKY